MQAEGITTTTIDVARVLIPNLVEATLDLRYPDRIISLTEERP